MSQVLLKNLPSTFVDAEINLSSNVLNIDNRAILQDTIEYLQDFLYVSERGNQQFEYVEEKNVLDLISNYK
jgi:hypothetical protein